MIPVITPPFLGRSHARLTPRKSCEIATDTAAEQHRKVDHVIGLNHADDVHGHCTKALGFVMLVALGFHIASALAHSPICVMSRMLPRLG